MPTTNEAPERIGLAHVVAVEPHQGPLPGRQADAIEVPLRNAEVVEFPHRIGLQVDADAQRSHLAHRLEHDARHADLMQGERRRQPADAAAGDEYGIVCHGPACYLRCPIPAEPARTRFLARSRP